MNSAVRASLRPQRIHSARIQYPSRSAARWFARGPSSCSTVVDEASPAKLHYPDAPTSNHSDLDSFVSYASRTGLDVKSTVYVGTHYEYTVSRALAKYGFFLRRIGGSSDNGTDLVGTWTLPTSSPRPTVLSLRVLVQCKAGAQRVGPQHIRELEGAFVGAPVGWRGTRVLGLLVSERAATKGVRESVGRSRWPMVYMRCSKEGLLSQAIWNQSAEDLGLEGYGVAIRRGEGEDELVLTHDGRAVSCEKK